MRVMRWTRDLDKDVAILRQNNKRGNFICDTYLFQFIQFPSKKEELLLQYAKKKINRTKINMVFKLKCKL